MLSLIGKGASAMGIILSETLSCGILAGATGSASGGLSIALSAFADNYLEAALRIRTETSL